MGQHAENKTPVIYGDHEKRGIRGRRQVKKNKEKQFQKRERKEKTLSVVTGSSAQWSRLRKVTACAQGFVTRRLLLTFDEALSAEGWGQKPDYRGLKGEWK